MLNVNNIKADAQALITELSALKNKDHDAYNARRKQVRHALTKSREYSFYAHFSDQDVDSVLQLVGYPTASKKREYKPSDPIQLFGDSIQRELLEGRLPHVAYCADDVTEGIRLNRLKHALKKKHIQINPPQLCYWLALDVDHPNAKDVWKEAGLREPNIICINPRNGHAHQIWGIKEPVTTSVNGRAAPIRYYNAIKDAYTERCPGGDQGYTGLMTKNPLNPHWDTIWLHSGLYSLKELAEPIGDLSKYYQKKPTERAVGTHRNPVLFDDLRHWAFAQILDYRYTSTHDAWFEVVLSYAQFLNTRFTDPLPFSEVKSTAKSVAKYMWNRGHERRVGYVQKKAIVGAKGGSVGNGGRPSLGEPWVAEGVSRSTYFRNKNGAAKRVGRPSSGQPWVKLGMPRSTYYRHKKQGLI